MCWYQFAVRKQLMAKQRERERETVHNKREVLNPGKACCLALEWNKVRHFWHIGETPDILRA